jgi:hypothetical protein
LKQIRRAVSVRCLSAPQRPLAGSNRPKSVAGPTEAAGTGEGFEQIKEILTCIEFGVLDRFATCIVPQCGSALES